MKRKYKIKLTHPNSMPKDSRADDELALKEFYEATTGWINSTGWANPDLSNPPSGVTAEPVGEGGELRVTRVDVRSNGITGQLTSSIGNWSKLKYINTKHNNLTGEIPETISAWTELEWLMLSGRYAEDLPLDSPTSGYHSGKSDDSTNTFSGVFPDAWGSFTKLKVLELCGTDITSMMHDSMGAMTELRIMIIAWNKQLYEAPAPSISNLTKLNKLYLASNNLQGAFPDVTGMTDLRQCWGLGNNGITTFPDFSNCHLIQEVDFDANPMEGSFPAYFNNGNFPHLVTIRAGGGGGNISGDIFGFENLDLKTFSFDGKGVTGTIGESLGTQTRMIILGLGWTRENGDGIRGELPQQGMENWDRNRYIRLYKSKVTGAIPTNIPNSEDYLFGACEFTSADPQAFMDVWNNGTVGRPITQLTKTVSIDRNRLTPKDFEPLIDFYSDKPVNFNYHDQKPFGTVAWDEDEASVSVGATIDRSEFDYTGNSYQWFKDDVEIAGETSHTIDTNEHGAGTYHLEITHPHTDITQTFTSKPVIVE